jgi:hypothetical protein
LLQELSHAQAELFASVLWTLWKSRNMRLWQNETETSQAILERARQLLVNWRVANRKRQQGGGTAMSTDRNTAVQQKETETSSPQIEQNRWQKPAHGRLKCNVDASFSEALNCVGFGFCIRYEFGNFIRAKTMWSNLVCSSDVGEALGLSHAIRWVHELQVSNVDFELDAKKVVDYFNRGSNDMSEFGAIVEKC